MLTKDEATTRVAKGAAHLDTVRPGWFTRIDVGTLTLSRGCACVLGQLFGDFWDGAEALYQSNSDAVNAIGWQLSDLPAQHGFVVPMCEVPDYFRRRAQEDTETEDEFVVDYQPLQDAWIAAIADRVLAAAQAHSAPPSTNAVREETEQPGVPLRVLTSQRD